MGVDLGAVRIGVAVSDQTGTIASPCDTVVRSGDPRRDREALASIATEWGVNRVVVGVPVSLDGRERAPARAAREEAVRIAEATGLAVETWDERLTTVVAGNALAQGGSRGRQRRAKIDASAAAVMLQGWLDAHPAITEEAR